MAPHLKYLQKRPPCKGNKEGGGGLRSAAPPPAPALSSWLGAMRLDRRLPATGPSSSTQENHQVVWPMSESVSTGRAPGRGGPQGRTEVGLARPVGGGRVQEAPGGRAHPCRHFGDLCPGRQSQPLAQSRMGTQGDQEPGHMPLPAPGLWSWETQAPSLAWGRIPGTSLPSSARLLESGGLALD